MILKCVLSGDAIWDNGDRYIVRHNYEAASAGDLVCSLGEAPYPNVNSREEEKPWENKKSALILVDSKSRERTF